MARKEGRGGGHHQCAHFEISIGPFTCKEAREAALGSRRFVRHFWSVPLICLTLVSSPSVIWKTRSTRFSDRRMIGASWDPHARKPLWWPGSFYLV